MQRRTRLIPGLAVLAVSAAIVAPAAGAGDGAPPFEPAVLGGQPPNAVVLAQEDDELAVVLALAPRPGGLLAVVTVLDYDGTGASGRSTTVTVTTADGRSISADARGGPLGTYQATLATTSSPVSARVSVDGPRSWDRPIAFTLPRSAWPPQPAGKLMRSVDRAYARLKTLVIHQRLASKPGDAVTTVYRAIAPHTLATEDSSGDATVQIGKHLWGRVGGGTWVASTTTPVQAIKPFWSGIVEDPVLLGSGRLRGRPVWNLSFAAPQLPAFFRLAVDKQTDRVLDLHMTAAAHFMHHVYGPFNSKLTITPPK